MKEYLVHIYNPVYTSHMPKQCETLWNFTAEESGGCYSLVLNISNNRAIECWRSFADTTFHVLSFSLVDHPAFVTDKQVL